jgi:hypothetical protein
MQKRGATVRSWQKPYLFATNNKLTPHHIKTNAHMSNKIKTSNHLINQPNQSRRRHLPPSTAHLRQADAAPHRPLRRLFRRKKKKEIRPLGVAAIHPNGQGREIRPPQWPFLSSVNPKKSGEPKKNSGQPKKSFLMPQKSILMPQNSFLMPQN